MIWISEHGFSMEKVCSCYHSQSSFADACNFGLFLGEHEDLHLQQNHMVGICYLQNFVGSSAMKILCAEFIFLFLIMPCWPFLRIIKREAINYWRMVFRDINDLWLVEGYFHLTVVSILVDLIWNEMSPIIIEQFH